MERLSKMKELLKPGIYQDISAEDYHALPYLGSSTLKRFKSNPLASQQPFASSPSMELGTAIHLLALEGKAAFDAVYYVADIPCPEGQNPKGWKSTNRYKEALAIMFEANQGKTALTLEQIEAVNGMNLSLRDHPTSSMMLNRGNNEVTVIWQDEATGLMCKARPDDYHNSVASDLKSCADIEKFPRDIYYRHYDIQGAFYTEGLEANQEQVEAFCFIAVQSTSTYPVRVGYLSPDHMQSAQKEMRRLMGLYAQCKERNVWPNYAIPTHIFSLDDLSPNELLEVW